MWYTAKQARTVAGMAQGTFTHWLQRGLARPSVPGKGHGGRSKWSETDLIALMLTKHINETSNIDLISASNVAAKVTKYVEFWEEADTIALCGKTESVVIAVNLRTIEYEDIEKMIGAFGDDSYLVFDALNVINGIRNHIKEVCDE